MTNKNGTKNSGSLTAKISHGNQTFTATEVTFQDLPPDFPINARNGDGWSLFTISFGSRPAPGATFELKSHIYEASDASLGYFTRAFDLPHGQYYYYSNSGTVTISAVTPSEIRGTFNSISNPYPGAYPKTTIDGSFVVSLN